MFDVIITGAHGFVGKALVKRLLTLGYGVKTMGRADGDVSDAATWADLPAAKALIHLAGSSYVPDSWKNSAAFISANVVGTEHALAYCRRHAAHMVFASAYIYGIPTSLPISETAPVVPSNPYALSKYLAEQLCTFSAAQHGLTVTILRLFNVIGPGQRTEFLVPTIVNQVKNENTVRVMDLAPRRDYVHVRDVVEAFVAALKRKSGCDTFNIGSGTSYSVQDVIDFAQRAAGKNLPIISNQSVRPSEIPDVIADITHARTVLDWCPQHSLQQCIHELLFTDAER